MGLMTAYYAAPLATSVTILEKSRVGDPATASFSLTRSARNDYVDPEYARLAYESRRLWLELQAASDKPLLVDCGCLNLAKRTVTPDLASTYAFRSYGVRHPPVRARPVRRRRRPGRDRRKLSRRITGTHYWRKAFSLVLR